MKKTILLALFALCSSVMFAQTTVTGTVTAADDGSTIAYANVQEEGTTNLVFTDDNGKFSINIPSDGNLIISFMGYVTQKVPVNGKAVINVVLAPEAVQLDETIVVAYGTAKKGTYTGAASVVKSDALKNVPTTSFENALNGKVAGLQITQSSGQAGSTSQIRIRGIGSMNASNEPLYVIDGVPVTSGNTGQMSDYVAGTSNNVMNTLNPSDIESITVLKDAAASALYGSRAANGVIMVTTKKGKMGKPTVTFKASVGITPDWATDNYEVASTQENIEMLYEIFWDYENRIKKRGAATQEYVMNRIHNKFTMHGYLIMAEGDGPYPKISAIPITQENKTMLETDEMYQSNSTNRKYYTNTVKNANILYPRNGYYDWEDAYFRTAVYQTYDLSVSGGTENTSYYSSFAYTSDKGRIKVNDFSRLSGRVNVNQKVGKHIEFQTSVNIAHLNKSGYNDTRNMSTNYFMQTRNLLWGYYHPYSYIDGSPWTERYGSYGYNQVYYQNEWENESKTFKVQASEALTVHILDGLDAKTIFSYDNSETKDHIYYSANHYNGSSNSGSVTEMSTQYKTLTSSTTLNYNKTFKDKHTIGLLAGFELEDKETVYQRAGGSNLPTSSLHTVATAGVLDANAYSWGNSMVSILSRAEYNYDGRYYLSGSYRRDGSSKLEPDTRWGNFWSVAGSWKINNEKFMKNIDWISNLRIRASYGVNGTLPSDNYGWRSLTGYSYKYNQNPGGAISTIVSNTSKLSWETSYTTNVALEFGFWDQRLYGTVEYFNRDSKDLLQDVPISTITGFSSILQNIGEINNKGIEIELGGDIIRNKDLTWSASVTASTANSKVTKLYGGQDIIWSDPTGGDGRCTFIYREGESMLAVYGREWAGVNSENGYQMWYVNGTAEEEQKLLDNGTAYEYKGRVVVEDADGETYANRKIIGNLVPKLQGGFNTSLSYRGLDVSLNFIYKFGDMYDGAEEDIDDDGYYWERTRSKYVYDNRWKEPGDVTDTPRLLGSDPESAMLISTRHIYNGNFLRLKNVTVGYNFPKAWVNKIGLGSARVYFNGSNLLTFAANKKVDPEVNAYGTRGWETPFGRTYTFGLELSF